MPTSPKFWLIGAPKGSGRVRDHGARRVAIVSWRPRATPGSLPPQASSSGNRSPGAPAASSRR